MVRRIPSIASDGLIDLRSRVSVSSSSKHLRAQDIRIESERVRHRSLRAHLTSEDRGRRAVDQDEGIIVANFPQGLPKAILPIIHVDELDGRADQVPIRMGLSRALRPEHQW